ncbi:hypothetical protein [Rothia nasimurium]|uniref:hypothetical protein n=1 Tax=Rothia nasimurium TaxID=85336 RepID=UPI001F191321|nr:hypothetical protein [Rothia nasimurium]
MTVTRDTPTSTAADTYAARWFREMKIAALEKLLSGEPLTADHLHTVGLEPPSRFYWGAVMKQPEIRAVARPAFAGWVQSPRTGGTVRVWELKPGKSQDAAQILKALKESRTAGEQANAV